VCSCLACKIDHFSEHNMDDGKKKRCTSTSNSKQSKPWPAGRSGHAMAYDPKNKVVYMHGGYDGSMHIYALVNLNVRH